MVIVSQTIINWKLELNLYELLVLFLYIFSLANKLDLLGKTRLISCKLVKKKSQLYLNEQDLEIHAKKKGERKEVWWHETLHTSNVQEKCKQFWCTDKTHQFILVFGLCFSSHQFTFVYSIALISFLLYSSALYIHQSFQKKSLHL